MTQFKLNSTKFFMIKDLQIVYSYNIDKYDGVLGPLRIRRSRGPLSSCIIIVLFFYLNIFVSRF